MVIRHNRLRDEVFDLCHHAHLSGSVERGHDLTRDLAHTSSADIPMLARTEAKLTR